MAGRRDCDTVVTAGRMSKANEFFAAADHLGEELPNAAGDLYVDAGIAASDVICCVRLGTHSNTGNHHEAVDHCCVADRFGRRRPSQMVGS